RLLPPVLRLDALPEPVRQVEAHCVRQLFAAGRAQLGEELGVGKILQRPRGKAEHADERGDEQRSGLRGTGGRFERAPAPQYRKRGFGDEGAVFLAEIAMLAEVGGKDLIGGRRELQELAKRRYRVRQQRSVD